MLQGDFFVAVSSFKFLSYSKFKTFHFDAWSLLQDENTPIQIACLIAW